MQSLNLKLQTNGVTIVPNYFLDTYMPKANGEFVKVYLFLIRAASAAAASTPLSVSILADKLNNTEKDILRALKYWEGEKLLSLTYDNYGTLTGIEFTSPEEQSHISTVSSVKAVSSPKVVIPDKPSYSRDAIEKLTNQEDFATLLFVAQSYTGKTLSSNDTGSLVYIHNTLKFSTELTEYLIEYCVSLGHKSFSYIEKVAISWAEQNIRTIDEAKAVSSFYKKEYYQVLKEFGINKRNPVDAEITMVNKWQNDYAFSMDIILDACRRTMSSIHQPSFEYADSILTKWYKAGVKKLSDVSILDDNFSRNKDNSRYKAQQPVSTKPISNKFNNMPSRSYVYDDLEKQLLGQ